MIASRPSYAGLLLGGMLVAFGAVLLAETTGLVPAGAETWIGTAILAAIGLGFLAVSTGSPSRWWAIIPAGTMLSLAVVTGMQPFVPGAVGGSIFLFGLAATFAAVALVPAPVRSRTWAWVPAAVLAILAVLTLSSAAELMAVFWSVALMLAGVYLVARWAIRGRRPGS